MIIRNNVEKI